MKRILTNKTRVSDGVTYYGNPAAFETYERGYGDVQIRDNRPDKHRKPERHGVVFNLPTIGGQFATYQLPSQAVRLARKIVRMLNAEIRKK